MSFFYNLFGIVVETLSILNYRVSKSLNRSIDVKKFFVQFSRKDYLGLGISSISVADFSDKILRILRNNILTECSRHDADALIAMFCRQQVTPSHILCFPPSGFIHVSELKNISEFSDEEQRGFVRQISQNLNYISLAAKKILAQPNINPDLATIASFLYDPKYTKVNCLGTAMRFPSRENIYVINGYPVITLYGFVYSRQSNWENTFFITDEPSYTKDSSISVDNFNSGDVKDYGQESDSASDELTSDVGRVNSSDRQNFSDSNNIKHSNSVKNPGYSEIYRENNESDQSISGSSVKKNFQDPVDDLDDCSEFNPGLYGDPTFDSTNFQRQEFEYSGDNFSSGHNFGNGSQNVGNSHNSRGNQADSYVGTDTGTEFERIMNGADSDETELTCGRSNSNSSISEEFVDSNSSELPLEQDSPKSNFWLYFWMFFLFLLLLLLLLLFLNRNMIVHRFFPEYAYLLGDKQESEITSPEARKIPTETTIGDEAVHHVNGSVVPAADDRQNNHPAEKGVKNDEGKSLKQNSSPNDGEKSSSDVRLFRPEESINEDTNSAIPPADAKDSNPPVKNGLNNDTDKLADQNSKLSDNENSSSDVRQYRSEEEINEKNSSVASSADAKQSNPATQKLEKTEAYNITSPERNAESKQDNNRSAMVDHSSTGIMYRANDYKFVFKGTNGKYWLHISSKTEPSKQCNLPVTLASDSKNSIEWSVNSKNCALEYAPNYLKCNANMELCGFIDSQNQETPFYIKLEK